VQGISARGQFKSVTAAIIGEEVMESLAKYHFTKGFRGTNGAEISAGFTTPEIREAKIKQFSMRQYQECYVLCDSSKIDRVSFVTFAGFEEARVITIGFPMKYTSIVTILFEFRRTTKWYHSTM